MLVVRVGRVTVLQLKLCNLWMALEKYYAQGFISSVRNARRGQRTGLQFTR